MGVRVFYFFLTSKSNILLPSGEEKENRIKLGLLMDGKKKKNNKGNI